VLGGAPVIPNPPPPPQSGDDAGQIAVLEWYQKYDPNASNKEIAEYCRVRPQTIKNWRNRYGILKSGEKEVP
jgi:uncharacterized protein YjcR